jgi:excisionase family DNA binding protein
MENERKTLTPFEVAEILGVNPKSIYKELKAGHIPHVKVGDRYIISRESFFKWFEGNQAKANSNVS